MAYVHTKRAKNSTAPEVTEKYYLSNSKLLPEVLKAKAEGKMTNELAKMLMMLTKKYAQRPCFSGYSYKEDMISEAMTNLCQNALKFNHEKSNNPFSYYTSCINNSFLQFLNLEKKHRKIRDQLLIDVGENPSYNFQEEYKQQSGEGSDFKSELDDLKNQIAEAHVRVKREEELALIRSAAEKAELDAAALLNGEEVEFVDGGEEINHKSEAPSSLLEFGDGPTEFTGELDGFIQDKQEDDEE